MRKRDSKIIAKDEEPESRTTNRTICLKCGKDITDRLLSHIEPKTAKPKKTIGQWKVSEQAVKNLSVSRL